jgi:hypothetical protein
VLTLVALVCVAALGMAACPELAHAQEPPAAPSLAESHPVPIELTKAPTVEPWPTGLPPTFRYNGATCLPKATAQAAHRRFVMLDLYPELCQSSMDSLREALETRTTEQRNTDEATCKGREDRARDEGRREAEHTPWLERLGYMAIGAAVVGAAIALAR